MQIRNTNLRKKLLRRGMILLIIIISYSSIEAQFNSEIGYTLGYMPATQTNDVINRYNKDNTNKEMLIEMKPLHYFGGFNAGLNYRFGMLKIGAFWESLSAKRESLEGPKNEKERTLYFVFNTISTGLELQFQNIGIGSTFDYNLNSIKFVTEVTKTKVNLQRDNYFSNKIYLIFYLKATDRFGIAFKPYVRLPWKSFSLDPLASHLELTDNPSVNLEKFIQFGLAISILNGKQPLF